MSLLDIGMLPSDDPAVIQEVKVWTKGTLAIWGQTIIRPDENGEDEIAHLSVNYGDETFSSSVTGSLGELIEAS